MSTERKHMRDMRDLEAELSAIKTDPLDALRLIHEAQTATLRRRTEIACMLLDAGVYISSVARYCRMDVLRVMMYPIGIVAYCQVTTIYPDGRRDMAEPDGTRLADAVMRPTEYLDRVLPDGTSGRVDACVIWRESPARVQQIGVAI